MKRYLILGFVLVVVAVNWAALHDILKGEPDTWLEWSFVIVSAALLVVYVSRKIHERAKI